MKRIIALLLALTMAFALCACGGTQSSRESELEKKQANYGLYIKDSELVFADLKDKPYQLSSRLLDDEDFEDEDLLYIGYTIGVYSTVSSDGSLVFFPDKINNNGEGYNLYYRNTNEEESDSTKIDSNVTEYIVNTSSSLVTYVKGTGVERNLYQYSIKDDAKEKIASSVVDYYVTEDGNKVAYYTIDGDLYLKTNGADKEKIASEIAKVVHLSEDYNTFYYIKDETLYKQSVGADREKIDSNIYLVIQAYDTGEMYYLKQESEFNTLMDYVTDDLKAVDEGAPTTKPSEPRKYYFDTTEEYNQAYSEYETEYEAYYNKLINDEWRTLLESEDLKHVSYCLYYYNGTESKLITETFTKDFEYAVAADKPVISYVAFDQEEVAKKNLSEFVEAEDSENLYYEFKDKIDAALYSSSERYIAVVDTAAVMKQEKEAKSICINDLGTEIYYVDDIPDEKDAGDLYKITITDNVLGEPELYDSEVYEGIGYYISDKNFLYFKEYKDGSGDLYVNKTNIDYDVKTVDIRYNNKLDKLYYFIDWDAEKEYGILKEYANGESAKIADDVHSYSNLQDGKVLYLYDYSMKYLVGELYQWEKGEKSKIDEDVIYLIPNTLNLAETKKAYFTSIKNINTIMRDIYAAPAEAPAY